MPEFRQYIVCRHTSTGLDPASAMGPDHTPKEERNADDSGIRRATSYGLQGPKCSENRSVALPGFTRIQQGGGVTNRG